MARSRWTTQSETALSRKTFPISTLWMELSTFPILKLGDMRLPGIRRFTWKPLEASRILPWGACLPQAATPMVKGSSFASIGSSGSWVTLGCSVARGEEIISRAAG